jgi:hypothetical protein
MKVTGIFLKFYLVCPACSKAVPFLIMLYNTNMCVLMTQFTGLLKDSCNWFCGVLVSIITSVVILNSAVRNYLITWQITFILRVMFLPAYVIKCISMNIYVAGIDKNTLTSIIALF